MPQINFKPTILFFSLVIVFCAYCIFHIPVIVAAPVFGLGLALSFMFYHFGRISVLHQTMEEKEILKIKTQADQIDEIACSPTVELFPDIKNELLDLAAEKYDIVGEIEKAKVLRAHKDKFI